jgi:hypothetical protein
MGAGVGKAQKTGLHLDTIEDFEDFADEVNQS